MMIRTVLLSCLLGTSLWAQNTTQTRQLDLQPSDGWVDTSIALSPGDTFDITATGQLQYTGAKTPPNGPDGLARGYADLIKNFPVNSAGRGALVGRIGDNAAARPFLIGSKYSGQSPIGGHLFVAINQSSLDQASGSYHLTISRTAATAQAPAASITVPPFPQTLLNSVPRRVTDPDGAPGDRVNFIVVGSAAQMKAASQSRRMGRRRPHPTGSHRQRSSRLLIERGLYDAAHERIPASTDDRRTSAMHRPIRCASSQRGITSASGKRPSSSTAGPSGSELEPTTSASTATSATTESPIASIPTPMQNATTSATASSRPA